MNSLKALVWVFGLLLLGLNILILIRQNEFIKIEPPMTAPEYPLLKKPFFEARLEYQKSMAPVLHEALKEHGELLGSGTGIINGDTLNGEVHWSIYEEVGEVCNTSIYGTIKTPDGAVIRFQSRGYGRVADDSKPDRWDMPAVLRFETNSPQYLWLNQILAIWTGDFDMATGKHTYTAWHSR